MSAYSESYLDDAMKNLGEAFDYASNACNISPDTFMDMFVASGNAGHFGKGNPKFISGLSGTELVLDTLSRTGISHPYPGFQTEYDCSPEYWCGWVLAYYQWKTGNTFKSIHENLSMDEVLKLYSSLHEASEDKFVDTANHIFKRKHSVSNLQHQRNRYGFSQRELSEKSGVNLRTLQQYELKTKDISKASFKTVVSLANTLGCKSEDLMEYPTVI